MILIEGTEYRTEEASNAMLLPNSVASQGKYTEASTDEPTSPPATPRGRTTAVARRDRILDEYLAGKIADDESLPAKITLFGYAPDWEALCAEVSAFAGFDVEFGAAPPGWFVEKVRVALKIQFAKTDRHEPAIEEKRAARTADKERDAHFARILEAWLQELKDSGRRLRLKAQKRLDRLWVARQTRIPVVHLFKTNSPCYAILRKAVRTIGLERAIDLGDAAFRSTPTYRILFECGTVCRRAEVRTSRHAAVQTNNTRHALLNFLKVHGLHMESLIGAEFGRQFAESVTTAACSIANRHTRKKFVTEINRWQRYYRSLTESSRLPAHFGEALQFLVVNSGCTYIELGALVPPGKPNASRAINSWARGQKRPSRDALPLIENIEDFFHLPRNTLVNKAVFHSRRGVYAAVRRGGFARPLGESYSLLASYLPADFPILPLVEQRHLVETASKYIRQNKSEYRRWCLEMSNRAYRVKIARLSERTRKEFRHLIEYKTAIIPPPGYRRGGRKWHRPEPGRAGSVGFFKTGAEKIFGALTAPKQDFGGGMRVEQLSIIHLFLPDIWRSYLDYVEKRNGHLPLTSAYLLLSVLRPLLDARYGWITQSPHLAERLEPIDGLIAEKEVALAKTNWLEFVRTIEVDLDEIRCHLKQVWKTTPSARDSHLPILPILESAKPLRILADAIRKYELDLPPKEIAPFSWALGLRNVVFLRILAETALRRRNLVELTWNATGTGQVRRGSDGLYEIEINYAEFKNSDSSFFGPPRAKRNYKIALTGKLSVLLDEYLNSARRLLLKWGKPKDESDDQIVEESLFVSHRTGPSRALSVGAAVSLMRVFTAAYLVYNPLTGTGIKGVEPFRLQAVRHIVASHVLKMTGSYFEAGRAIQDTAAVAERHYAHYAPEDLDRRFRHHITSAFEDDKDEQ